MCSRCFSLSNTFSTLSPRINLKCYKCNYQFRLYHSSCIVNAVCLAFHSSTSFAFTWATACAAVETPGTVCDWRNVILELFAVVVAIELALFNRGLLGGMGGGCRTPIWFFFSGGVGWVTAVAFCDTLWARIIVATFVPAVIELALSCRSIWPGEMGERAIPVAEKLEARLVKLF